MRNLRAGRQRAHAGFRRDTDGDLEKLRTPIRYLFVAILLALLIILQVIAGLSGALLHLGLTTLLLLHVSLEIAHERRTRPEWWLITPPTLASILTFAIPFALTNVVFFGTFYEGYIFSARNLSFLWLNKALALAVVASLFMWIGYRLSIGRRLGRSMGRWLATRRLVRLSIRPSYVVVALLYMASLITKYLMVRHGAYGVGATERTPELHQYLIWGKDLSTLCILVIALDAFSDSENHRGKLAVLAGMAAVDVFWGFVSGFKFQVVFPLIVVGVAYYAGRGRVPRWMIMVTAILLVAAYAVVEPYRGAIRAQPGSGVRDLRSMVGLIVDIVSGEELWRDVRRGRNQTIMSKEGFARIAARANLTGVAAAAVRYKDETSSLDVMSTEGPRIEMIATSPVRAVVPRLVWPDKPTVSQIGGWFRVHGWGGPVQGTTSVGMSTVGYLYIAGGLTAVIACFLLLGVFQRFVVESYLPWGGGGMLVFIGLLAPLAKLPTTFDAIVIDLIRMTPLLILVQFLMLGRDGRNSAR